MIVEIYGQPYSLKGEGNEKYLSELARYVDGKMRSISDHTKTVDTLKLAILSALNIADELFQTARRHEADAGQTTDAIQRISVELDRFLESSQEKFSIE